jgi:predicted acyltransferase
MTATTAQRDLSLDSFRGVDVLLMILVNVQGNDAAAFPLLKHAEWNGLTFADLVFPIFLLIVGLSAPLAFDRPGITIRWSAILRRTFLLFMIGVGLSWLIKPTLEPDLIRWTGVLQRIAIVYLVCVIVIVIRRGARLAMGITVFMLAFHSWMAGGQAWNPAWGSADGSTRISFPDAY